MRDIFILTEADLRQCVTLGHEAISVVEEAFRMLASGKVIMPPILSMEIPDAHGEVDVKTAYIPGFDGFAIKVSPGFFDNPKIGLPSLNGLMILFSAKTGLVEALLLDNGYLTDVRTAAAGAVAASPSCSRNCRDGRCAWHGRASPPANSGRPFGPPLQARARMGKRPGEGRGLRPRSRIYSWHNSGNRNRRTRGARKPACHHDNTFARTGFARRLASSPASHHGHGL